jgi:hypothetical protein
MACALLGVWLLVHPAGPDLLAGYEERQAATGPLYARGWSEGAVARIESLLPAQLARVEERLGRRLDEPLTTILVGHAAELRRLAQALGGGLPEGYTVGIAFPARRTLVVRGDLPLPRRPEDPAAVTLTHELAHLVLHRRPDTRLPRWLDEGLAMWVSQGQLDRQEEAYLSLLARADGLYRLETLESAFPRGHQATSIAYQQSLLLVEFLASRHGETGIHRLLDHLEAGRESREALRELTGLEHAELEAAFFAWVRARQSLLGALAFLINPWTVAALLAIVAFLRYLLKRRRLLRRMEEAETAESEQEREEGEPQVP